MNNKFKGLYDTEKTTFITDKTEPINYYEPTIKTTGVQNHTYSINFDKTELYKEIEKLQQELKRKDKEIKHLKSELECYENGLYFSSEVEELQDKLDRKDNIIKSLISYLETQINDYKEMGYNQSKIREKDLWMAGQYDEDIFILDKIKEIESK